MSESVSRNPPAMVVTLKQVFLPRASRGAARYRRSTAGKLRKLGQDEGSPLRPDRQRGRQVDARS